VLEDVRISSALPLGESEDLMGLYFEWLRENYSSFDGNATRKQNGKRAKSKGGTKDTKLPWDIQSPNTPST
jgi:hypothetical protein